MTLGERIKFLRKTRKITLKELSKNAGISISFLSDIENGRSNPSLERLKDIAESLKVTTSFLLGENNHTQETNNIDYFSIKEIKINTINEPSFYNQKDCNELPPEAITEIKEYIKYICNKYKR